MRLLYLANVRLPTEKAHGAQIMQTCAALARQGLDVTLVVPERHNPIQEDPFAYYGMERTFAFERLRVPDLIRYRLGPLGFALSAFLFAGAAWKYVRTHGTGFVYSRDEMVLWWLGTNLVPCAWESHTGSWNFFARLVSRRVAFIAVISHGLKSFYVREGVPAGKVVVAPDGVDLDAFEAAPTKQEARAELGFPKDARIALYAGRLDGWKGAATFCAAATLLPEEVRAIVVGGEPAQVADFAERFPRVEFLGAKPYRELPAYQAAADILVLPNTAKDVVSSVYTSPLKLFTYMASGVPIVSSDLPSIREVLGDDAAYFVEPDDAPALAEGIERALSESEEAARKAQRAREEVKKYTWDERARVIAERIGR